MRHFGLAILALVGGLFALRKDEKAAEDSLTVQELVFRYDLPQLEALYMQSVSLDNKTDQKKLKAAISRKRFENEYQSEGA